MFRLNFIINFRKLFVLHKINSSVYALFSLLENDAQHNP